MGKHTKELAAKQAKWAKNATMMHASPNNTHKQVAHRPSKSGLLEWFYNNRLAEITAWHKEPLALLLIYGFIVWLRIWTVSLPSPGEAVAALAVAAGIMSLRGEMGGKEKVTWMLVLFCFLFIELRAIKNDHEAATLERLRVSEEQQASFKGVAKQIGKTMDKSNEIMQGLRVGIGAITGGNSFVYLEFWPEVQMVHLRKVGGYPIYDLRMTITNVLRLPDGSSNRSDSRKINIGNIRVGDSGGRPVQFFLANLVDPLTLKPDRVDLDISFEARSGTWEEMYRSRYVSDPKTGGKTKKWLTAIRVYRFTDDLEKKIPLFQQTDPTFPMAGVKWD